MHNFFMFFGIFLILIGLPICIILTILFIILKICQKEKSYYKIIVFGILSIMCPLVGIFSLLIGGFLYGQTDEYQEVLETQKIEEEIEVEIEGQKEENYESQSDSEILDVESLPENEIEQIDSEEIIINEQEEIVLENFEEELSEENKNELCVELYYDDVFFGDNLSKGDYVKLHIMVSENRYFTADAIYSDSFNSLMDEWNLYRDFKACSVLREGEDSYFGVGKVDLYFSNNFQLNPNSYDLGDKLIVYGEVISFYKDEWDGYNDVIIVPVFIEEDL